MMKVTIEVGRITVQGQDSKECKDILKAIYPQFLEAHKNSVQAPVIESNIVNSIEIPDRAINLGRSEFEPIESDRIYPSFRADYYKTHKEGVCYSSTRHDRDNKKLVFFKCEECGTIACSFMNPNEPAKCFACGHHNELGELFRGAYNCSCGQEGVFLMQEDVSEVQCKTCRAKHIMIKDGDEFIAL